MSSTIQVVVRFRPLNKTEEEMGPERCIQVDAGGGPTEVLVVDPHKYGTGGPQQDAKHLVHGGGGGINDRLFTFDGVLDVQGQQQDLFDLVGNPTVDNVMKGYNGTILAYGQTGSGKTHSMVGPQGGTVDALSANSVHYADRGIIPRIVEALFDRLEKIPVEEVTWKVTVSVFELYLEMVQDLLTEGPQQEYRIREDNVSGKGIYVENLYAKKCQSASELLESVRVGVGRRKVASTKSNETSSRSHSLTVVSVEQINHVKGNAVTNSRLYLVDLAGSEKVAKTGAVGDRLKEAQTINSSLSLLGSVIYKLTDGKSTHIPFRNSKLTRILQESFGGNSVTTLLCHCSPAAYNKEETLSTLRFAARAKQIRNKPRVNRDLSTQELQMQYNQALDRIRSLEEKLSILSVPSANGGGSAISPSKVRNVSLSPTRRREKTCDAEEEEPVYCGVEGHADMQETINNLLAELDDVKRDFYDKTEEAATAEGQVKFYKERAAKAEEEAIQAHSKLKRDNTLYERRLLDLQVENERLLQELGLYRNVAVTGGGGVAELELVDMPSVGPQGGGISSSQAETAERTVGYGQGAALGGRSGRGRGAERHQIGGGANGLQANNVSSLDVVNGPPGKMVIGDDDEPVLLTQPGVMVANDTNLDPYVRSNGAQGGSRRVPSSSYANQGNQGMGATGAMSAMVPEVMESLTPQGSRSNPRGGSLAGVHGVPHIIDSPSRPTVSTTEIGITAQIGRSEAELLLAIEDLEQSLRAATAAKLAAEKKDVDREAKLQRLGADLEKAHDDQDGLREELDNLRKILESTTSMLDAAEKDNEKLKNENKLMRDILAKLNIDLEEYSSLIGNEKLMNARLQAEAEKLRDAANSLMATQEQQEYCEIAGAELVAKTEDMDVVDNELGYMSYAALSSERSHAAFQATRASCEETLLQLKNFLTKLLDTLQGRTFNTSNLESQRLAIISDSTGLLSRVENAELLLSESPAIGGGGHRGHSELSPYLVDTPPVVARQQVSRSQPPLSQQSIDPRPPRRQQQMAEPQDDPAPSRIMQPSQTRPAANSAGAGTTVRSGSRTLSVVDARSFEPSLGGGASRRSGSGAPPHRAGSFRR